MAMFDLSLDELQDYRPDIADPPDFDEFWAGTIAGARRHELVLHAEQVPNKLAVIDTFDLTFGGFDGSPVRAWLHVPRGVEGPLPAVVQYHGYSRGRGFPHSSTLWAQAGYAHFVMDTRGQGWSIGGPGQTPDASLDAGLTHSPGFMTAGITDPAHYYYRRVYTDAVRLLELAAGHDRVDPRRIVVTGGSQGGGITLAAAGLADQVGVELAGAAPDVPFLCHFQRAVALTDRHPYGEITQFLSAWREHHEAAYRTLGYFDGVNLGKRATAPALFSVALMDPICPPSTVFAAYNHYAGPDKQIRVYPHNEHEGGGEYQLDVQLDWVAERVAAR